MSALNCDTLFVPVKVPVEYSTSLDSFGFDSSNVVWHFHGPEGYLFQSNLGSYRLAFREGKKWRSWTTGIGDLDYGKIFCNWQQVDGKGKSELVIWEFQVFGHHAATHGEERQSYWVHIWDVETATELLLFNFRNYYWYADVDLGGDKGPEYDAESKLIIGNGQVKVKLLRNIHNDSLNYFFIINDSGARIPIDRSNECPPADGSYKFENGCWIRTSEPFDNHHPALRPPEYYTWWESGIF